MGDREQRILWLERQYWQLPDLDALAKRLAALEQQQAASWMYAAYKQQTTCEVSDFPAVCACLPATFLLNDSYYGDVTMTYSPTQLAWLGCNVVTLPSNASCTGPVTFALHYALTGDRTSNSWTLVCQYKTANFTTHCPVASTCADAANQSVTFTVNVVCSGSNLVTFAVNGTTPGTQAWPAFRNVTLSWTW